MHTAEELRLVRLQRDALALMLTAHLDLLANIADALGERLPLEISAEIEELVDRGRELSTIAMELHQ